MRLVLDTPSSWTVSERTDGTRVFSVADGADLLVEPIVKMPPTTHEWRARGIRIDCSADVTIEQLEAVDDRTALGWPIHLIEAVVHRPGKPDQHRLACFYRLLEYSCIALVTAPDRQTLEARREEIVAVLATGRPHWRTEIASIHDLWQGMTWDS